MALRYPPLNPLRVFSVVARTKNLTAAAQELHVSQSAVTRQITVLESYVGMDLFKRERHGVTLTPAGAAYAEQINPAFEQIAAATARLMNDADRSSLSVMAYTTFSAKWLIPRLSDFMRRHPSIQVRIINSVVNVDFDRDAVDVAIQYGDGHWPKVKSDFLLHDQIEPVCTPSYLSQFKLSGKDKLYKLLEKRLLVSQYRSDDWDDWLAHSGLQKHAEVAERMSFSNYVLTWQAALDGLGMAIGYSAQLKDEIDTGRLVTPFSLPLRRDKAYYLVRPVGIESSPKVRAFRDWLLDTTSQINRQLRVAD